VFASTVRQLNVRVDDGLWDRVQAARGDVSLTRFVVRALEKALGEPSGLSAGKPETSGVGVAPPVAGPAPSRAPERPSGPKSDPAGVPGVRKGVAGLRGPDRCPKHPDAGFLKQNGRSYCDAPLCMWYRGKT
jgi:hypothetical protein